MPKEMLINVVEGEECRIAVVQDGGLEELYMERASIERHVGNIYKGRVNNIEPTIQAAFVDIGMSKNGFLHASDVIPASWPNRKKGGDKADAKAADDGAAAQAPEAQVKPKGRDRQRQSHKRIQEIFRPGDEVVVQITKEGIGTKGPSLTTALSIPGRYLVLMPGLGRLGVSKKIEDEDQRRELRDLLASCNPPAEPPASAAPSGTSSGISSTSSASGRSSRPGRRAPRPPPSSSASPTSCCGPSATSTPPRSPPSGSTARRS